MKSVDGRSSPTAMSGVVVLIQFDLCLARSHTESYELVILYETRISTGWPYAQKILSSFFEFSVNNLDRDTRQKLSNLFEFPVNNFTTCSGENEKFSSTSTMSNNKSLSSGVLPTSRWLLEGVC